MSWRSPNFFRKPHFGPEDRYIILYMHKIDLCITIWSLFTHDRPFIKLGNAI